MPIKIVKKFIYNVASQEIKVLYCHPFNGGLNYNDNDHFSRHISHHWLYYSYL